MEDCDCRGYAAGTRSVSAYIVRPNYSYADGTSALTRPRFALCVVLACGVASGGASGESPSIEPPLPIVSGQQFTGLIVPRLVNFDDSWTPTEAQVVAAEPNVQQFVVSQRPNLRSTLSRWFRQYSGITKSGKRMLRVDFFDTRHFPLEKLRHPLVVCDGDGESTLVIVYDFEDGTCSWL